MSAKQTRRTIVTRIAARRAQKRQARAARIAERLAQRATAFNRWGQLANLMRAGGLLAPSISRKQRKPRPAPASRVSRPRSTAWNAPFTSATPAYVGRVPAPVPPEPRAPKQPGIVQRAASFFRRMVGRQGK